MLARWPQASGQRFRSFIPSRSEIVPAAASPQPGEDEKVRRKSERPVNGLQVGKMREREKEEVEHTGAAESDSEGDGGGAARATSTRAGSTLGLQTKGQVAPPA